MVVNAIDLNHRTSNHLVPSFKNLAKVNRNDRRNVLNAIDLNQVHKYNIGLKFRSTLIKSGQQFKMWNALQTMIVGLKIKVAIKVVAKLRIDQHKI